MTTVSDDFTGPDGTTNVWFNDTATGRITPVGGKPWVAYVPEYGHWGISNNKLYRSSPTFSILHVDVGFVDGTMETDYTPSAGSQSGVVFRYVDPSNYIRVLSVGTLAKPGPQDDDDPTPRAGSWYLQKVVAGTTSTLWSGGTVVAGTTYRIKVTMDGPTVTLFSNDVLVTTATIPEFVTSRRHGLDAQGYTTDRWDNFSVTSPVIPPPGVPTSVGVDTITDTSARLHWGAPATGTPTDYEVRITPT